MTDDGDKKEVIDMAQLALVRALITPGVHNSVARFHFYREPFGLMYILE